ncbi:hypothetical protein GH733_016668 [Mirounga leonina]|nr:hypothetical protein GH733_016668 [Mirounga leonina]
MAQGGTESACLALWPHEGRRLTGYQDFWLEAGVADVSFLTGPGIPGAEGKVPPEDKFPFNKDCAQGVTKEWLFAGYTSNGGPFIKDFVSNAQNLLLEMNAIMDTVDAENQVSSEEDSLKDDEEGWEEEDQITGKLTAGGCRQSGKQEERCTPNLAGHTTNGNQVTGVVISPGKTNCELILLAGGLPFREPKALPGLLELDILRQGPRPPHNALNDKGSEARRYLRTPVRFSKSHLKPPREPR